MSRNHRWAGKPLTDHPNRERNAIAGPNERWLMSAERVGSGRRARTRDSKLPAFGLILPDDALVPVDLVLDPILKYATRLGELSNNLVATLSFAISTNAGRKVQGLSNSKFMRCHVLLQQAESRQRRRHTTLLNTIRFGG